MENELNTQFVCAFHEIKEEDIKEEKNSIKNLIHKIIHLI